MNPNGKGNAARLGSEGGRGSDQHGEQYNGGGMVASLSESALIGALLQEHDRVFPICQEAGITAASFTVERCARAWATMERMRAERKPVELLSVSENIGGDSFGAMQELEPMLRDCATTAHAAYYAEQVRNAERRRGLHAAARLALEALARGDALDDVGAQLRTAGEAVEDEGGGTENMGGIRPFSTRAWDELAGMELPPPEMIWGGFTMGGTCVVFGQGGLGKSRLALNLARNQVLGIVFAGLPTAPRPLRHLFIGSENSIHRLQNDVRRMNAGLSPEQVAALGAHIRLATLEGPEDTHISLATPRNVERWARTLEDFPPDVLWADPWGDLLAGEANSDEDARATLSAIRRLLRKVNNSAALGILAHARTGARNIIQAIGYDAANFGKGSKALYSSARCVWNLAPGDETENPALVCVHAKSNDSPRIPPFAVSLDPETMLYSREAGFDFEAWQSEVGARANGKGGRKPAAPLETFRPHVLEVLNREGKPMPSGVLHSRIAEAVPGGMGQKRVRELVADCLQAGIVAKMGRAHEPGGGVLLGTPEQIAAYRNPKLPIEAGSRNA